MTTTVTLRVYDLSRGMARSLSPAILGKQIDGIWHTGVVAFGNEYFFGGGIQAMAPELVVARYGMPPVDTIHLGATQRSQHEFESFLRTINHRFTAATYDLLHNNCNNFSNEVALFLVGQNIPRHILDLPNEALSTPLGAMIRPMIEDMQREMNATGAQPFAIPFNDPSLAAPALRPTVPAAAFAAPLPVVAPLSRKFAVSSKPTLHLHAIITRIQTLNTQPHSQSLTSDEIAALQTLERDISSHQIDLSKPLAHPSEELQQKTLQWWTIVQKLLAHGPTSAFFLPALALFRVLLLLPIATPAVLATKNVCFDHLLRVTETQHVLLSEPQTVLVLSVLLNGFANPVASELVLTRAVQFLPFVFYSITETQTSTTSSEPQRHGDTVRVLSAKLISNCCLAMKIEEELVITTLLCGCAEVLDRLAREQPRSAAATTDDEVQHTLEGVVLGIGRLLQNFQAARSLSVELGLGEVLRRLHGSPALRTMQPLLAQVAALI